MQKYTRAIELHQNGTLTKLSGSDEFIVATEFVWWLNYETKQTKVVVEKGMKTDLGSIPRIFRIFFNRNKYVAYILHDCLYTTGGMVHDREETTVGYITRKQCDIIMCEALKVEGCNMISRWLQYWAVRVGGGKNFKK